MQYKFELNWNSFFSLHILFNIILCIGDNIVFSIWMRDYFVYNDLITGWLVRYTLAFIYLKKNWTKWRSSSKMNSWTFGKLHCSIWVKCMSSHLTHIIQMKWEMSFTFYRCGCWVFVLSMHRASFMCRTIDSILNLYIRWDCNAVKLENNRSRWFFSCLKI